MKINLENYKQTKTKTISKPEQSYLDILKNGGNISSKKIQCPKGTILMKQGGKCNCVNLTKKSYLPEKKFIGGLLGNIGNISKALPAVTNTVSSLTNMFKKPQATQNNIQQPQIKQDNYLSFMNQPKQDPTKGFNSGITQGFMQNNLNQKQPKQWISLV